PAAEFPVTDWSPHWLAYSRYDGIAITGDELRKMPSAVQSALWQYVECGGCLLILGGGHVPDSWKRKRNTDPRPAPEPALILPQPDGHRLGIRALSPPQPNDRRFPEPAFVPPPPRKEPGKPIPKSPTDPVLYYPGFGLCLVSDTTDVGQWSDDYRIL